MQIWHRFQTDKEKKRDSMAIKNSLYTFFPTFFRFRCRFGQKPNSLPMKWIVKKTDYTQFFDAASESFKAHFIQNIILPV